MTTILHQRQIRGDGRLLVLLGDTPDEVASSLKALGFKGVKHTARFLNPIVRYALGRVPGTLDMDVMSGKTLRTRLPDGTRKEIPLPAAVVEFLVAFNRGDYPDLEKRP